MSDMIVYDGVQGISVGAGGVDALRLDCEFFSLFMTVEPRVECYNNL